MREDSTVTEHVWVKPVGSPAVHVSQFGREDCPAGYCYGPAVRDHYLLHFIVSGRGVYSVEGRDYALRAGQGFLICPEEITRYTADGDDPWSYFWIGISGRAAADLVRDLELGSESPVFRFPKEAEGRYAEMRECPTETLPGQLALLGVLYGLLSKIRPETAEGAPSPRQYRTGRDYVESAILYIQENYPSPITVAGLAEYLGLNRCYFATLFREHTHTSPRAFLVSTRLGKAAELLAGGHLSVTEVAKSVGYEDPLLFSRMFRKEYGASPLEYRRRFAE